MNVYDIISFYDQVRSEISKVIVGGELYIRLLTIALLARGHVLLEGVPGIAKTLLAKSFSRVLSLSFKRIQFTPDMLPADLLGTYIFNQKTLDFEFKPGPVFANIILADEINRAPPKTQSALLEAMQERQITIDGKTMKLPEPFMVIATQNPIEQEGTYPLPEAQLDRFMFRIVIGYPSPIEEIEILRRANVGIDETRINPILSNIVELSNYIEKNVYVSDDIFTYIQKLVIMTRSKSDKILLGCSPRSAVILLKASKVNAAIDGRNYVIPDDIKLLTFYVFNHRMIIKPEIIIQEAQSSPGTYNVLFQIIDEIIKSIEPPR
ncbi:MAG: MoxR family ATPase [Thermoprotei archaeon]